MRIPVLLAAVAALGGCASIVDRSAQTVMLRTTTVDGKDIADAECTLANDWDTWHARTPSAVTIKRSINAITVTCTRPGFTPAGGSAPSTLRSITLGNAVFGGILGSSIDMGNGAAYAYPDTLIMQMQAVDVATIPAKLK